MAGYTVHTTYTSLVVYNYSEPYMCSNSTNTVYIDLDNVNGVLSIGVARRFMLTRQP